MWRLRELYRTVGPAARAWPRLAPDLARAERELDLLPAPRTNRNKHNSKRAVLNVGGQRHEVLSQSF